MIPTAFLNACAFCQSPRLEPYPTDSTILAPFGEHRWLPGIIIDLSKNRGGNTVEHLRFQTEGQGRRIARELY